MNVDFYYYSTAMGDTYWDFVEDFVSNTEYADLGNWMRDEHLRRSAVLN